MGEIRWVKSWVSCARMKMGEIMMILRSEYEVVDYVSVELDFVIVKWLRALLRNTDVSRNQLTKT